MDGRKGSRCVEVEAHGETASRFVKGLASHNGWWLSYLSTSCSRQRCRGLAGCQTLPAVLCTRFFPSALCACSTVHHVPRTREKMCGYISIQSCL